MIGTEPHPEPDALELCAGAQGERCPFTVLVVRGSPPRVACLGGEGRSHQGELAPDLQAAGSSELRALVEDVLREGAPGHGGDALREGPFAHLGAALPGEATGGVAGPRCRRIRIPFPVGGARPVDAIALRLDPVAEPTTIVFLLEANGRSTDADAGPAEGAPVEPSAALRELDESLPDMVWSTDASMQVSYLLPAARIVGGAGGEDRSPTPLAALLTKEAYARLGRRVRDALELESRGGRGFPLVLETEVLWRDGSLRLAETTVSLVRGGLGRPDRLFGVTRDVPARRKADERERHIAAMRRRAQMLESLGLLAEGVAHDFNNVLMGYVAQIGLIRSEVAAGIPPERRLATLEAASHRAAALCRQLMTFAGRRTEPLQRFPLNLAVAETTELLSVAITPRVELRCELAPGAPEVEGDRAQLRQVVMNLVRNASEAIRPEDPVVWLRTGELVCDEAVRRHCIPGGCQTGVRCGYIEVEDRGCGMERATRERVFQPYFSTKGPGRGLGLATVLGIARAHGGGVYLQSEPGEGTIIRVLIPVAQPAAASPEPVPPASASRPPEIGVASAGSNPGQELLVVDDDAAIREGLALLLEQLGFRVLTAPDGPSAVRRFEERHATLSAVILDHLMPGLDGVETLRRLRRISTAVPVIVASGCFFDEATSPFEVGTVDGFLRKPFEVSALDGLLRRVIGARRPE